MILFTSRPDWKYEMQLAAMSAENDHRYKASKAAALARAEGRHEDAKWIEEVERARRALQGLGQQIDADHQVRRAQPPADPERLAASARAVSETAGETDRVLRSVYRELNDPE